MAQVETADSAAAFIPAGATWQDLTRAASGCRGCRLYAAATQTVFGAGAVDADIMLIGEQPGDQEDRQGVPFVGPAGQLLNTALSEAGLPRERLYVTNAVKHFKWEPRGKRRLHKRPTQAEVMACRPWLSKEAEVVAPRLLVCLGVTAASSVFGRPVRLSDHRGQFSTTDLGVQALVTIHPSALLRRRNDQRRLEYQRFVDELGLAAKRLTAG